MLSINECRNAAFVLGLGHGMQGQGGFSGGFRAVNFHYPAPGISAHAQGLVQGQGTGSDHRHLFHHPAAELHDGAFAELALNLPHGRLYRFVLVRVFFHMILPGCPKNFSEPLKYINS